MGENMISIPLERYEELVSAETRLNTAVSYIVNEDFVRQEAVLWILGTELACERAMELKEESMKRMEKA